ncbi:FecR family protein [Pedobacter nyackensis]|uniref:FecR family protein n=1 Tax=Pedobacter nyackensis TaxID=475255 RepID=UPI00292E04FB|nr:FecR domain-containing protein [Pedobacter nyackensis]
MKPNNVIRLIEKYQQGLANAQEQAIVEQWLDDLELTGHTDLSEEDKLKKMQLMESDLLMKIRNQQSDQRNTKKIPLWIAAAAASILLVLSVQLFFIGQSPDFKGDKNAETAETAIPEEINKATLILPDGKSIPLQNHKNAPIVAGNNVSNATTNAGKLVYGTDAVTDEDNTLVTPKGAGYEVVLPDGSTVVLNTSSKLIYPVAFRGNTRTVRLIGQAYFEVKSNPSKPFFVVANGVNIQVHGTGFDVNAYPDEPVVKTTLVHGAVQVTNDKTSTMISPGQQATLNENDDQIKITKPNLDEVLAWKKWEFRFEGADIVSILKEVSRWYDLNIIYKGEISDHRFSGSLSKKVSSNELLEILEKTKHVHFEIDNQTVTVLKGPKK